MKILAIIAVSFAALSFNQPVDTIPAPPECPNLVTSSAGGKEVTYSPIDESLYLARVVTGTDTTFVTTLRISLDKPLKKSVGAALQFDGHATVALRGELDYHVQDGKYIYTYTALLDRPTLKVLGTYSLTALKLVDHKESVLKKNSERFRQYAVCLY
jgi:hypothetical protein